MKRIWVYLGLAGLMLLSFSLRQVYIVHAEHAAAQAALAAKRTDDAMRHYANALHAWLPLLPERGRVLVEMQEKLLFLEKAGELDAALKGWRRLRAALVSTRGIWGQPDADMLRKANRNIARLAAATDAQGFMSAQDIEREALQLLESHPRDVDRFWGSMQFLLLLAWIGAVTAFLWLPHAHPRRRWLLLLAPACFGGWLTALYLAG